MADSKITALTSIGASTDPANDPLVLVDVSDTSMAATGTTKKVTLNQLLGAGGTATLASATITGDLTVDTSTLKVDSANNRVGIGTASPQQAFEVVAAGINTIFNTASAADSRFELRNNNVRAGYVYWDTSEVRLFADTSRALTFYQNGTLGMTLNSTGLGVGVTPGTKFDVGLTGAGTPRIRFTSASDNPILEFQRYSGVASDYYGERILTGGGFFFQSAPAAAVGSQTFTTNMSLNASGNVGIGVAPKSWLSSYKAIQLGYSTSLSSTTGTDFAGLSSNAYVDSVDSRWERIVSGYATQYYQNAGDGQHIWRIAGTAAADTAITWTNAMTLDASGNLLVGTTTNGGNGVSIRPSTASPNVVLVGSDTSGGTAWQLYSTGTSSNRFYVTWAGVVNAVNTTISGISDARLKENVQDIDVGLGAILALKPRKFDWKAGKGKDIKGDRGFIAQEFEQVFPQLVDEWADPAPEGEAPYKSVRQDLIPVLVKAIQELTARVQTLETR